MKILLSGHAASPIRGSEPGVAWNWAWHLAKIHEVHLLTFPEFKDEVEVFLASNPQPNLHVHWIKHRYDTWDRSKGNRGIRLHYLLWQRACLDFAFRLHKEHKFDLAHHISWSTISSPPLLWKLPIPFFWGPIGGGMTTPRMLVRLLNRERITDFVRTLRVSLMPYNPALRLAVKNSKYLIAANNDTAVLLSKAGANDIDLFLDTGLNPDQISKADKHFDSDGLSIFWAGRLEEIKAVSLAIRAMTYIHKDAFLTIAGDGSQLEESKQLVNSLGLGDRVRFLGSIQWSDMTAEFTKHDVFLYTSIRDSFGGVVLEAMAQGLPIVSLFHQGISTFLDDTNCIAISVSNPELITRDIANTINALLKNKSTLTAISRNGLKFAKKEEWSQRAKFMTAKYKHVLGFYD